jgi:hypothetical protein
VQKYAQKPPSKICSVSRALYFKEVKHMTDRIVSGETTTNTFCYMYMGAKHMLQLAGESEHGQLYNIISCITYCAFTLEAYFNHLGSERNSDWKKIERKIPKSEKYKLFCQALNIEYNLSNRPYKTMAEVFSYRDQMAHGKTTVEKIDKTIDGDFDDLKSFDVGPDWKTYSTIEQARMAVSDTKDIIQELHTAAGFTNDPFLSSGGGVYRISTS